MRLFHMLAIRALLTAIFALIPAISVARIHGQGVSRFRNGPFNDFDLKAIGVVLVVVMVIVGIRAVQRRRS